MENNEKRFPYCKFTIVEEKEIIRQYQEEKKSMAALGREWQCDPTTIKNIMKAYSVNGRTLSEARRNYLNYTIIENIFTEINSPDKAYWLGVMYSDGYISKTQYTNKFGISVAEKDEEWLEKFKEFLGYNGEISHYKTAESAYVPSLPYVRLLIGNNQIVKDLEKWGVVEHKTKKINKLPDISYLDDFVRGYIDGDGSLAKRLPHITISGNKEFLRDIANYFDLPYYLYQDKTIYSLQYNKICSEYLEKRLYKNANYFLSRKYEIASRSFNSPLTLKEVQENSLNCGETLQSLNNQT